MLVLLFCSIAPDTYSKAGVIDALNKKIHLLGEAHFPWQLKRVSERHRHRDRDKNHRQNFQKNQALLRLFYLMSFANFRRAFLSDNMVIGVVRCLD